MIDLANAVGDDFDQVVFASNPRGIFPEDISRFSGNAKLVTISFVTRATIGQRLIRYGRSGRWFLAALSVLEPLFFLINVARFTAFLRTLCPSEVLVCNGGYPAAQSCLAMVVAARLCGLDATLSVVSTPLRRRPHMWPYEWLIDRVVWRCVTRVIVNARIILAALCDLRGMPEGRGLVIYNGIDECEQTTSITRDPDTLTIGCVARVEAMKGVFVLLEAFRRLAVERADLRLVLAGDGDASDEIARRVQEFGLEHRVKCLGHFAGDVNELLRSFDIFAFPSLWEGFPYSILEALRAGCAIVSTNVGGIPEAIVHEQEGLLIAPGDPEALYEALQFLTDVEQRQKFSKAARARFEREFSLHEMQRRVRAALLGTP